MAKRNSSAPSSLTGNGGELHQTTSTNNKLTTNQGVIIADGQNTFTVGPRGPQLLEDFGLHTFRMIDAKGEAKFVKFHWRPKLGTFSVIWPDAVKINGADPDFHRRDFWNAINAGDFPEWELSVQAFTEEQANEFDFDVLDATKLIPEELVPLSPLGKMVLNRNVDNFFAETEQVAFCPSHLVPGIDFSNDPLLQGRLFSYLGS